MRYFTIALLLVLVFISGYSQRTIHEYTSVVRKGKSPVEFVNNMLGQKDLIVLDDALHSADEPFRFYIDLVQDKKFRDYSPTIFIEVLSIAAQPQINRFLQSPVKDSTLLMKVFQDDFSGYGWRYQTCLDLLAAVWDANRELPDGKKIEVVGVDQPIYWEGIHARQDYDIFQQSLAARDYFMYKVIAAGMKDFKSSKKGIFLTNTRHAYKAIRHADGRLYWNAATFLHQYHPGKIYSVRMHNVSLYIEKQLNDQKSRTTEGLDRVSYRWVRIDGGKWDSAFSQAGNRPVAFSIKGNVFGNTPYIGNHMLDVQKGQTMQEAYDAVIFLKPIAELHSSAIMNYFYTPVFKQELQRRILVLHNNDSAEAMKSAGVPTMDSLIRKITSPEPRRLSNLLRE